MAAKSAGTQAEFRAGSLFPEAGEGTATGAAPSPAEFTAAAIEISRILRDAKVEAPLRPKTIGGIILALYQGEIEPGEDALGSINRLIERALMHAVGLPASQRGKLIESLRLSGVHFERLAPAIPQVEALLNRLQVRSALQTGTDFLGLFYEAFLRYGYDNNALGIVFTPRHITRFCVGLLGVGAADKVIDVACGTGGFLVSAYDAMRQEAEVLGEEAVRQVEHAVCGSDTNPTVWSLACLNMFFRMGRGRWPAELHDNAWASSDVISPAVAHASSLTYKHAGGGGATRTAGEDARATFLQPGALQPAGGDAGATFSAAPRSLESDGESRIDLASCFDPERRRQLAGRFSRAFLNPPFSQDAEPEKDFIDASLEALRPGGLLAAVVYAGIFADEHHAAWRAEFTRKHSVVGMISLPEDLFYPTAAPTTILIARAHVPQGDEEPVFMSRVWNDGFEKLKNRRVERPGSELPEVERCFQAMLAGRPVDSKRAVVVAGTAAKHGNEWSPQQWLPQFDLPGDALRAMEKEALISVYRAVTDMPELAEVVIEDFAAGWNRLPALPGSRQAPLNEFFYVENGKSAGEKNYPGGSCAYVSSGDASNSIVRLVEKNEPEAFEEGAITVTAFGQAYVQPWPFLARGNGGSSVRVLLPKYRMSLTDLLWFTAQINAQKWRFFYARMAIKGRIERLMVTSPPAGHSRAPLDIAANLRELRDDLARLSEIPG